MVNVDPQGPEKRWNYILWSIICGVLAGVILVVGLSGGWLWALIPVAVMVWGCVQYGIWAARGRRDRGASGRT